MTKRMLIDATQGEETRVVLTSGSRVEDFDFDVAILFSDILWPLQAMGMNLVFDPGPKFEDILTEQNFKKLLHKKDLRFMEFQSEALQLTKEKLGHDKSLIGFVGGPWTVLSFGMGSNKSGSNSP